MTLSFDPPLQTHAGTLGIIAGGGELPVRLLRACRESGRPIFVLAFEEATDPELLRNVPHAVVRMGAVGEALSYLRSANVKEIVMAGNMRRPSIGKMRLDAAGTKLLARLGKSWFSGDDGLLRSLVSFLEDEGFHIIGVDEVMGDLLAPQGQMGNYAPSAQDLQDIELGLRVSRAVGALDVGQAVLVQQGIVLGVEAAEGTDGLIQRCASLRREGGGGVLVKCKKPGQERRVDLPAIGWITVERMHRAGFVGIACEADGCVVIDRPHTIRKANELGLFLIGITAAMPAAKEAAAAGS